VRWTNWCGERAYYNLQFAQPSSGMGIGTEEMPSCVDASQPSRLIALDSPPTGDPWQGAPAPGQIVPTPGMMSEPPVCDPTTLHLKLLPVPSPGHYVGIDGKTSGGGDAEFCVVDAAEMTVTITDPNGQLLPVDRNGETIPYDWQGSNGFVWDNWCGEDGPFTITVTIAGQTLELEVANGPECTHEEEPSAIWGPADTRTRGP
jgi:hypothetical protein